MKSALECLTRAKHCEAMVRDLSHDLDRRTPLEAAKIWRQLAESPKLVSAAAGVGDGADR